VLDPIVGPQRKADLLDALAQREGIPLEQTVAVGDGANDLLMIEKAGLGIAFHAKPKLRDAADTSLTQGGLDRILYLLGLRARDVRELVEG
jgi:phosphoserine phosphatase